MVCQAQRGLKCLDKVVVEPIVLEAGVGLLHVNSLEYILLEL